MSTATKLFRDENPSNLTEEDCEMILGELQSFFTRAIEALRSAATDRILFFEPDGTIWSPTEEIRD